MANNVHQIRPEENPPTSPGGSGGGGDNLGEKLAKLEARMENVATKTDMANINTDITRLDGKIESKLENLEKRALWAVILLGLSFIGGPPLLETLQKLIP